MRRTLGPRQAGTRASPYLKNTGSRRTAHFRRLRCETLESRQLLSVSLNPIQYSLAASSDTFSVSGTIAMTDENDYTAIPLKNLTVKLMDDEPWPFSDEELGVAETSDLGTYLFENVNNDDGFGAGGRDLYITVEIASPIARIEKGRMVGRNWQSDGIYEWWGSTEEAKVDDNVDGTDKVYNVNLDMFSDINRAAEVLRQLETEYDWIKSNTTPQDSANFASKRDQILVRYDDTQSGGAYHDEETIEKVWWFWSKTVPEHIQFFNDDVLTSLNDGTLIPASTVWHEFGHAVMYSMYGKTWPPNGQYPDYNGDGDGEHFQFTQSDDGLALIEGWAEFIQCAVPPGRVENLRLGNNVEWTFPDPHDPTKNVTISWMQHENTNLEDNSWWTGHDQNLAAPSNPDGSIGSICEGAVASILWDLYDGIGDDDFAGSFQNIFTVIAQDNPTSIWRESGDYDFYHSWVQRFGESDAVDQIFIDHGIPVRDDQFKGNTDRQHAQHLNNLDKSYGDLILDYSGDGNGKEDWFSFYLQSQAPADAIVRLGFDARGKIEFQVFDANLNPVGTESHPDTYTAVYGLAGLPKGLYYIKVYSPTDDMSPS